MTAASHRQMAAVDPDRTEVDYDNHHKYNKVHVRLYCLDLNDLLIIHTACAHVQTCKDIMEIK